MPSASKQKWLLSQFFYTKSKICRLADRPTERDRDDRATDASSKQQGHPLFRLQGLGRRFASPLFAPAFRPSLPPLYPPRCSHRLKPSLINPFSLMPLILLVPVGVPARATAVRARMWRDSRAAWQVGRSCRRCLMLATRSRCDRANIGSTPTGGKVLASPVPQERS